jgi:hypothetical protein
MSGTSACEIANVPCESHKLFHAYSLFVPPPPQTPLQKNTVFALAKFGRYCGVNVRELWGLTMAFLAVLVVSVQIDW